MTPLPGVSEPAGLRPSPLAPLSAAAQPSLCPASAGKAGQQSLRQLIIRTMDWIWNPLGGFNAGYLLSYDDGITNIFIKTKCTWVNSELTCCWICPLVVCTTICSPVVVVAVVYCSIACYYHGPLLKQKTHTHYYLTYIYIY